jgi:hypothetical protein
VGSRLIDAAAAKITDDFFKAFEARLQPAGEAPSVPVAAEAGTPWLWWVVGAAVLLALLYFVMR